MGIRESEVGMELGEPGGRRGEVICVTSYFHRNRN